jgi:hypothetical protein
MSFPSLISNNGKLCEYQDQLYVSSTSHHPTTGVVESSSEISLLTSVSRQRPAHLVEYNKALFR